MGENRTSDLLAWYDANRRILPWREDPTPYHVWLSEIMLQQTRGEAVKGYYSRFLEVLPDIRSLAEADEDTCTKLWEGLGYYSRVRNLHKAAQQVMENYGGSLPRTVAELKLLAGIGDYTATAIASIAFSEPVAAIDGNLLRVFSRQTGYSEDIKAGAAKKAAKKYFDTWISQDRPGAWNQALMDLGATVCLPNGKPLCDGCPLQSTCVAHAKGLEEELPVSVKKVHRPVEEKTVFILHNENGVVLHRRPESGLLAGLYEFPNTAGTLAPQDAIVFAEKMGFQVQDIGGSRKAKHVFSHREWHMTGYDMTVEALDVGTDDLIAASFEELDSRYSVPSAFAAFREFLGEGLSGPAD